MKKIFTLMLALACALFAGVSCTNEGATDNGGNGGVDPNAPVITVSGAPAANLTPEAGEFTLNFAVANEVPGALKVTCEAAWVTLGELGDASVAVSYAANTDNPGSEPREAVIVFAHEGAESVLVTLKQDSAAPQFAVTFDEATLSCGYARYTCVPTDSNMLYFLMSSQDLGQYGVQGETATEKMQNFMQLLVENYMLTTQADMWFVYQGATTDMPKEAMRFSAEDEVEVYAVGVEVLEYLEDGGVQYATAAKLATAVHVWQVPFLPYPSVVVAEADMVKNVTAAAGSVTIDCVLNNPLEDAQMELSTEASWVVPTWADNKLTLTYEANEAAVARRAKISVAYGYYTNPFEVTLVQEKNSAATAVELNIEVTGTQFNGIWVNVTSSDPNVTYALNTTAVEKDYETGAETEMDWMSIAEQLLSYNGTATFHQGNLTNHFIKMNPSMYEWDGYDYYVYGFAVNEEKTLALSEVSKVKTTIDASRTPSIQWVAENGVVWNETNGRYDLEVVAGSTVTIKYDLQNPVEGGVVALNGTPYDSYNVIDEQNIVLDTVNQTVTFSISEYDTAKKYHYIGITLKYTNEDGDYWGITTKTLRLTQVQQAE